jgi:hypothetical protein
MLMARLFSRKHDEVRVEDIVRCDAQLGLVASFNGINEGPREAVVAAAVRAA